MSKSEIREGTDDDVRKNLEVCSRNLFAIAHAIPLEPVDDFVGLVSVKLLSYAGNESLEASVALRRDIKAMSWRTRNLLETWLLLLNCNRSIDRSKAFAAQKIKDEAVMLTKFVGERNPDEYKETLDRVRRAEEVLKKHGFENKHDTDPWKVDKLADEFGLRKEYDKV